MKWIAAVVLLFLTVTAQAQQSPEEAANWRADLQVMAAEMEHRHKDLYHSISREEFAKEVQALDARIPSLQRHEIIVELMRLAARVGDGHTNVAPTRDAKIGFHALPVRLYFFEDGLYVRAAAAPELVGARVTQIGGVPVDEAYRRVGELISRDNEFGVKQFAPLLLAMPEVLHALKLSRAIDAADFTFADGRTVTLQPYALFEPMPADTDTSWEIPAGWTDARGSKPPLWLENPRELHRLARIGDALYVQLNQVNDAPDETLEAFAARIEKTNAETKPKTLILDLRLDRGGNGHLRTPLMKAIIRSPMADVRGRLFVLTSRATFSAAQFLVDDLQTETSAIFIGEPTSSKPNVFGDSRKITLPHSGITVRASIYWWQRHPAESDMQWLPVDIAAPLRFADYARNIDPALEAAMHYTPEPTLRETFARAFATGGVEAAKQALAAFDANPVHRYAERELELLRGALDTKSLDALRLAATALPRSAEAHIMLADALARAKDLAGARAEAKKALELDPKNYEAEAILRSLPN
ncbi:MAG TPA: hypothetical protein VFN10_05110 [Thermoanaerobaculia bacterium]|nr:hypothetical protein [Thermoanaerobaculia bacterium]